MLVAMASAPFSQLLLTDPQALNMPQAQRGQFVSRRLIGSTVGEPDRYAPPPNLSSEHSPLSPCFTMGV